MSHRSFAKLLGLTVALALAAGFAYRVVHAAPVTLANGTYTAVVSPNGVTFTAVTPPCVWPVPPSLTPACGSGGNQTGGTWQQGTCPAWAYASGSCPTVFAWQAPRDPTTFAMAKPAKGAPWTTSYGTTEVRATAHATDIAGSPMARNDYSRREPFNADNSRLLVYIGNGYWGTYDARTWAYLGKLNGPAGDAEIQWDPSDPKILYYLPNNGGTVLSRLDVTTNTSTVQVDFTAAVKALWPTTVHCWTKSEGSPSRDGKFWGLMAEDSGFSPLGYFVLDIVGKKIVWSMPNSVRPDHVSMSPSGRWFVRSGDDAAGTRAYAIDGSGKTVQLHHKSEHSDIGVLPSGHDFYASVDYQTNSGDVFIIDIDTGASTIIDHAYANPWAPGTYSMHFSAKAYAAPGWLIEGRYGAPTGGANIVLINVVTGKTIALGVNYPVDANYFDEPHAVADRALSRVVVNGNFGTSQDIDVYQITVSALPQ